MKFLPNILFACITCFLPWVAFSQTASAERNKEMQAIMSAKPKIPIKTIGVLLYDGFNTLDAMGPYHTLSEISGTKVFFVTKHKGLVRNQSRMMVQVDTTIDQVKQLDILVIPGGARETYLATLDTTLLNWIRLIDQHSIYTTSVCTGSWILGATGLLKGKKATSNWYRADEMLKKYGAIFQDSRWVKDDKYWTSAGVTAGIDMSLAIINELMGKDYTQAVMLDLEYNPSPPVQGGTPSRSNPVVTDMMKQMYDMFMLPLFKKYEK